MKRLSILAATALSVLLCTSTAFAQFGDRPSYGSSDVSRLVDRVHSDLDHAYHAWHFSKGDRDRLNHAEKELREFAQTWQNYHFDKGELDDAISSVQHVLDNNRMPPTDRDALSDDVSQLRNMREAYDRHEIGR